MSGTNFSPVKWVADKTGTKYFCACKQTASQPGCDGSHNKLLCVPLTFVHTGHRGFGPTAPVRFVAKAAAVPVAVAGGAVVGAGAAVFGIGLLAMEAGSRLRGAL